MTIAYDSVSSTTGTAAAVSFTHTPVGAPAGIAVIVTTNSSSDNLSNVTYGGVAVSRVTFVQDAAGETGNASCYFVGSGIPAGAQTVALDFGASTADHMVSCYAVTAGADTEVVTSGTTVDDRANPSATLTVGGRTCLAFGGLYSGQNTMGGSTPMAGMTEGMTLDAGNDTQAHARQTTPGSTDFTFGWTATIEDAALVALALSEVQAAGGGRGSDYARRLMMAVAAA